MEWSLGRIKTQREGTGADVCLRESAACMEEGKCSSAGGHHGICCFRAPLLVFLSLSGSNWERSFTLVFDRHCSGLSTWR